jgi:hypothetical protein
MATAAKAHEKYEINVEGTLREWDLPTITVPQLRLLGGFDAGQQVLEVNLEDQSDRTLGEDEVVELKPGHGFGKKVECKRG